jgi:uncharacterized membrane protein
MNMNKTSSVKTFVFNKCHISRLKSSSGTGNYPSLPFLIICKYLTIIVSFAAIEYYVNIPISIEYHYDYSAAEFARGLKLLKLS